jgi:ArsR family transcriptional regulator
MKRLSDDQVNLIAQRAGALSDPTRVRILDVLARSEQPVGHIAGALESEPSTISKHLQVLFRAGLVQRRRQASTVIYSITADDLVAWCRYLGSAHLARV